MPKVPFSDFGKLAKKRLIDIGRTHEWLINCVREDTGLYFDSSYLHKIMTGKIATPKIISSICKILEIENPYEQQAS